MRWQRVAKVCGAVLARVALGGAALAVAGPAGATSHFLWGFDMDQVSNPRATETGFRSVTTCTFSPGQSIQGACAGFEEFPAGSDPVAGYLLGQRPFEDFQVLPLGDPSASTDLWADGHRVFPGFEATLRISGLPPGPYEVYLFSADPNPGNTRFFLNGTDAGTISSSGSDPDLSATGTLIRPVVIDSTGILDIRFRGVGTTFGTLNGVAIIPEPTPILLVSCGLLALASARGQR